MPIDYIKYAVKKAINITKAKESVNNKNADFFSLSTEQKSKENAFKILKSTIEKISKNTEQSADKLQTSSNATKKLNASIPLNALVEMLGMYDGPKLIALLNSIGIKENVDRYELGICIPASLVSDFSSFQQKLSTLSSVGRTFESTLEDKQIKINIYGCTKEWSEELSPPYTMLSNPPRDLFTISPSNSRAILQGECGITNATSTKPVLGTYRVWPCVAVVVYNSDTKVAALAHIDAMVDCEQAIRLMCEHVSNGNIQAKLEVTLTTSYSMFNSTLRSLKAHLNALQKLYTNLSIGNVHPASSIAIDSTSGNIMLGIDQNKLDKGDDVLDRFRCREMQTVIFSRTLKNYELKLDFDDRSAQDFSKNDSITSKDNNAESNSFINCENLLQLSKIYHFPSLELIRKATKAFTETAQDIPNDKANKNKAILRR